MKRIVTILAVMATFIISTFTASAQTVKKDFDLKGFTAVEFGNDFRATVTKADSFAVNVELSEELVPYLDVRVIQGALIVELRNVPTKLTLLKSHVMNVTVAMPELCGVRLNGSSKIIVPDVFDLGNGDFTLSTAGTSEVTQMSRIHLNGDFVTIHINSAGTSRIDLEASADELNVKSAGTAVSEIDGAFETMRFNLGGTSNVTLKGEAEAMDVTASGAGSVDALRMPVATATVRLSGAGVCKAYVKEALEVQCTGASTCSYKTDGEIKLEMKEITRTATLKKL